MTMTTPYVAVVRSKHAPNRMRNLRCLQRLRPFSVVLPSLWMVIVTISTLPVIIYAKNLHLTYNNYDDLTQSKTVFLKFYAPWCSFCKKMAADWNQLAQEWQGHEVGLVAEVDCTDHKSGGKKLCEYLGIASFPTLKYGDPHDLWDYDGSRSFEDMHEFAQENLVPLCSFENLHLCDTETKELLQEFVEMDKVRLKALIQAEEIKLKRAEIEYKVRVDELSKEYEAAEATRRNAIDEVMGGNLGMMRQVLVARELKEQGNKGEVKDTGDSSREEL